ncbi:hypothetical protein SUGI_0696280 [Cryptomeria japonica]|nr:hypothetical protein SUGI_0696280 [Cryptomeria japonica]
MVVGLLPCRLLNLHLWLSLDFPLWLCQFLQVARRLRWKLVSSSARAYFVDLLRNLSEGFASTGVAQKCLPYAATTLVVILG